MGAGTQGGRACPALTFVDLTAGLTVHALVVFVPSQISLKNGMDYRIALDQIKEARSLGLTTPVVLMGQSAC